MQGDWVARIRVAGGHVRQGVVIRRPGLFGRRGIAIDQSVKTLSSATISPQKYNSFPTYANFLPLFFNFKRFLCLLV